MEDTVHSLKGTEQGFLISDISLKQKEKVGYEVGVQGRYHSAPARSQSWPHPHPGRASAGPGGLRGRISMIPLDVITITGPVHQAKSQQPCSVHYFIKPP